MFFVMVDVCGDGCDGCGNAEVGDDGVFVLCAGVCGDYGIGGDD